MLDQKQRELVGLIVSMGGRMDAEDPRLDQFCDDRDIGDDTINLCFSQGYLEQVGNDDVYTIRLCRKQQF